MPKSIQASVTLLENLDIIVDKSPPDDLQTEILPMLYSSFESTTLQVQVALAIDYYFQQQQIWENQFTFHL